MAGEFTEQELTDITVHMIDYLSNDIIRALLNTFEHFDVPAAYFSFEKLADSSICIMNNGSQWEVFYYDRKQKFDLKLYDNIYDACIEAIDSLAENENASSEMKDYFIYEMKKNGSSFISSHVLKNALKQALSSVAVL